MTSNKDMDSFLSTYRQEYGWPSVVELKPMPCEPPKEYSKKVVIQREVDPWCHCDLHAYDPDMDRYRHMAEQEKVIFEDLVVLSAEMADLSSDILDHPCDDDDPKMKTFQQIDLAKRSYPIMDYRKLMTAVESPVGVPVKPQGIGLRDGFRDPTNFRFSAIPRPQIEAPPDPTFARTPTVIAEYNIQFPGNSEYMDVISKLGITLQRARQQYQEPLPSTRRQKMDPCI